MNVTAQAENKTLPVGDHDTPINPYVMQQLNHMRERINTQNRTMDIMYNRLKPAGDFYDWVKETHPDILTQYVSIRELEEVGKDRVVSSEMARMQVMGVPAVDHEGKVVVKYGNL